MKRIELNEFKWVLILAYGVYFLSLPILTKSTAEMGQLGDYMGGHLGAAFSFLSFLILLSSFELQSEALKITKAEAKSAEDLNKKQIELMVEQAKSSRSEGEYKTFSLYSDLLQTRLQDVKFYVLKKQPTGTIVFARIPELRSVGAEAVREYIRAVIENRQNYKVDVDQIVHFLVVFSNACDWLNGLDISENKKIFRRVIGDLYGDIITQVLLNQNDLSFVPEELFVRLESSFKDLST